jgi:hypothetical protein
LQYYVPPFPVSVEVGPSSRYRMILCDGIRIPQASTIFRLSYTDSVLLCLMASTSPSIAWLVINEAGNHRNRWYPH